MLKQLSVKNFAIIQDVTVEFLDGFSVLTGQTGAGKSLIIDSISLLFGQRSDSDMIRYNEDKAIITGIFDNNDIIYKFLEKEGIKTLEYLTIRREISKTKSQAYINDKNVPIQTLKDLGLLLADIHVQHDTYRLFNRDTYLNFIDPQNNDIFNKLYNDYQLNLQLYKKNYKEYNEILRKSKESNDKIDYLTYVYEEISKLNLENNEEEILKDKALKLKNFDKIFKSLKDSINYLENDYFSLDNIYNSFNSLKQIEVFDDNYSKTKNEIEESYYNLSDSLDQLKSYIKKLDYDEDELTSIESRLAEIDKLKLKYHKTFEELLEYQNEVKLEIEMSNNLDEVIKKYESKLLDSFNKLKECSIKLTDFRCSRAKNISKEVESYLKRLDLINTKFEIVFNSVNYNDFKNDTIFLDTGVDICEFMISLNLGEPLKPLSKVASGGELSRIMLAFKAYFAKEANLSLMIFDEIDSGVSGQVANEIANMMKEISQKTQVLAITHLPQVAAKAKNQYFIYKEERDGRTFTNVNLMDKESRVIEIAKMISGEKVTNYAISAATDLLNNI